MGKIKQGILGGFNGTTGSVVGASWKGIAYMRGKAQSIMNPRTTKQQNNRTLFGKVSDIMSKSLFAVNKGYKSLAVKRSPYNVGVKRNMDNFVLAGQGFNLSGLEFSSGPLMPLMTEGFTSEQNKCTIDVVFPVAEAKERKLIGVAIVENNDVNSPYVFTSETTVQASATDITIEIPLPTDLTKTHVYGYCFEYDEENKIASPTLFGGSGTPNV